MFWKFTLESSGLDNLLSKQDVTLLEVLDEEEVLQECKTPNEKLLDFITANDTLKELLHLVVDKPSDDVEESVKYKYMNIACEIIILDIDVILDKIASDQEFLDIIWSFTDNLPPLNPLIASFFSKVITMLVCRKSMQTFEFLKTRDAVNKLIVHIEISAIMELFIKMVTVIELSDVKMEICRWLSEEKLIEKLIDYLHPSEDELKHFYAGQLLSELVHIGRDSISQFLDTDEHNIENPLLLTLERRDIIEKLLSVIFDGTDQPNSDSSVLNGISVISSLIEIKRPTIEGMEELISPMDVERIAQGCHTALEVLATKLSDFHDVLVRPYPMSAMETTFGLLDPPLGKVRLNIAGLIAAAISTCSLIINESLSKTGTMNVLLDLFSRYEWNNFLHTHVQQCIAGILSSEIHPTANGEESCETRSPDTLVKHLFQECNIVQRCLSLWEANEISEKSGNTRKGYMGHLTKIINEIKNSREKGPNVETVQSMFNEFSDEIRQQWNELCEGSLEETNKKNICATMKSWFTPMDSDSEGDDYRHTPISQYDGTMQQAFENYQVKPMSNEFIETFGYDENSMSENENIKNPFDEVGKIDFTINANEESENEKLYNNICEQKIRPFDDSSDSDEEDMWEEKELTFSHPPQPRESTDPIHSDSDSSSDEEKDLKVDSPENTDVVPSDTFSENMDIDNEWTANFDSFGVSTEETSSEWPTPNVAVVAPLSTSGEDFANFTSLSTNGENFADFSDISNFDSTDDNACSHFDMETEIFANPAASSPYEVKMEEDASPNSVDTSSIEIEDQGSIEEQKSESENGVAVIEVPESTSPSVEPAVDDTAAPSVPTQAQSTSSIHIHIDSESNSEKRQNDTRPPEDESRHNQRSTIEPTESSPEQTGVAIDNNERTCKNEILITVNEPSPVKSDKQSVVLDTHSAEEDSVLLNGPQSPEHVNSSGNLAT